MFNKNMLSNKLFNYVKWNTLASVFSQAVMFITTVILARFLDQESYGTYGFVLSTVVSVSTVMNLGMGITATKYVSSQKNKEKIRNLIMVLKGITKFTGVLGVLLIVVLPAIMEFKIDKDILLLSLLSASGYVLFFTLNGYQTGILVGYEKFKIIANANLIYSIVSILTTILLTWLFGYWGACSALSFNAMIRFLIFKKNVNDVLFQEGIMLTKGLEKIDSDLRKFLFSFTVPAAVSSLIGILGIWGSNYILTNNSGVLDMAIFTVVSQIGMIMMFLPKVVNQVTMPVLLKMGLSNKLKQKKLFGLTVLGNTVFGFITLIAILTLSNVVLGVFGEEYVGSKNVLFVYLLAMLIQIVAINVYQVVLERGSMWYQLTVNTLWSFLLVFTTFSLRDEGVYSVALGYLFAWVSSLILYTLFALIVNKKEVH